MNRQGNGVRRNSFNGKDAEDAKLVQTAISTLKTHLLTGNYTVEFGLGTPTHPIRLPKASRYTQREVVAGPSCARPVPKILDR